MNKKEKIDRGTITRRLIREGRWAEAEAWKNKRIKRLREEGRERAWMELSRRFPPKQAGETA